MNEWGALYFRGSGLQGFEQKFNQFDFASSTVIALSSVSGFMRTPAITKPIPIITETKPIDHNARAIPQVVSS